MTETYEWDSLSISCIIFAILPIILHTLAIWFLLKTNHSSSIEQNVELLSLSMSIVVFCSISIVRVSIDIESPGHTKLIYGFNVASAIPFYSAMILLTLQRFFAIWLHLRYESSWVFLKRTHMVVAFLLGSVLYFLTVLIVYFFGIGKTMFLYYLPLAILAFCPSGTNIVFISVYIYIYIKFKRANQGTRNSLYRNQKSKIFAPFLICLSFFLFGTLPHFFQSLVNDFRYAFMWFYVDAVISSFVYIFNENALNRLRRWMSKRRVRNSIV